jgi:hypothetical protein
MNGKPPKAKESAMADNGNDPVHPYIIAGAKVAVFAPNGTSREATVMVRSEDASAKAILRAITSRLPGIEVTDLPGSNVLRKRFTLEDPLKVCEACGQLAEEFPTRTKLEAAFPDPGRGR